MFNQTRYEYLKSLNDQDKLSDIQRKEFAALVKEQQTKKVLDKPQEE